MDILKFEILEDGDEVVKLEKEEIHVRKSSGEYFVYTLIFDKNNQAINFNVFAIKKGFGSIEIVKDADLSDLSEAWRESNE
ncbi:hypothetical protein [Azotobacter beijerinckii]|uniref:Uncharacterized protein n=1 Tax=Azotobacter beijerinckii TaxID=170623 RepID=A0A1I4EVK4_9GAMM|nr:hypothetical protein [Azotobacter beijerinckii]SFB48609.1 hypothetical protein SAMN04244571_03157 [Azotobacter beijerinckii]SFL09748.1 hypothetical protein SAMN04244574_03091 [Azotobacter beijerinckii]